MLGSVGCSSVGQPGNQSKRNSCPGKTVLCRGPAAQVTGTSRAAPGTVILSAFLRQSPRTPWLKPGLSSGLPGAPSRALALSLCLAFALALLNWWSHQLPTSWFLSIILCARILYFFIAGDGTPGLTYARQMLYH